jgi:hypothetical protein
VRICDFPDAINLCGPERGHSCPPPRIGQAPDPADKNVRAPEKSQMRTLSRERETRVLAPVREPGSSSLFLACCWRIALVLPACCSIGIPYGLHRASIGLVCFLGHPQRGSLRLRSRPRSAGLVYRRCNLRKVSNKIQASGRLPCGLNTSARPGPLCNLDQGLAVMGLQAWRADCCSGGSGATIQASRAMLGAAEQGA